VNTTSPSRSRWLALGSLPVAVGVLVAINALYVFLVALGNITDYDTNYAFVQHVLSMDTTNFGGTPGDGLDPDIMWRAITDPVIWNIAYIGVIVWESLAAIVLIAAVVLWVRGFLRGDYRVARALSSIGLLMIVILFFGGFITVGGEWFSMWRSTAWNGLDPAFRNAVLAAITLVLIHVPVAGWGRRRTTGEPGDHDTAL
jgi:predicted small integral membrane protein